MRCNIPIHPFDFNPKNVDAGVQPENIPVISPQLQNQPNLNRVETKTADPINQATEDVDSFMPLLFKQMDRGVKEFFSDITVPTKDGVRKLDVRVAGGDKTILFWKQLMEEDNRIKLPVMSVNMTGWQLNPERLTPASVGPYFYRSFADRDGSRMGLYPREYSVYISYTLSVWTERKRDMGYIGTQIVTRFNPIAEWTVEDEFMCGNMIATFEGGSDNSDIDVDANTLAKVRYDYNIKVEGWLPLSGRVVPTVMGQVQELAELDTREFFDIIKPSPRR